MAAYCAPGRRGFEADDAVRQWIRERGYGKCFPHCTGRRIGANPDDLETHDERILLPGTGFSIEPGIYRLGESGALSEVNAHGGNETVNATALPMQEAFVAFTLAVDTAE